MTSASPATRTLDPAPQDSVSRVSFSPSGDSVLVSTWAGTLSLHDATTGALRVESRKNSAALLDAAWTSTNSLTAASLDGRLLHASITEAGITEWNTFGKHSAAARCLVPLADGSLASGGWDKRIRLWSKSREQIADVEAGGKVFGASRCGEHGILFINSERHVRLFDRRKTEEFLHDKVPPKLSYQLRGISASHDGNHYAVGSTAGRVAVEWLDGSHDSFSFKCHRMDGLAFPVNCIAHNRKFSTFATGGGDGHLSFWDGAARKRIAQYPRYPTSIASVDFDADSKTVAFAVSYAFEEGEKDHPPDDVHIRQLDDAHITTKAPSQYSARDDQGFVPQQNGTSR